MARPRKDINQGQFEGLCRIQCTLSEIADIFDCSEDTIERWCRRTYKMRFADTFKKFSAGGKMSLRRIQFKLAEKSPAMAIWLGKQYLGQREFYEEQVKETDDGFLQALSGTAKDDWNGGV